MDLNSLQNFYNASDREINNAFAFIKKDMYRNFSGITPSSSPNAFILGGQPGAGKSQIEAQTEAAFNQNIVSVSADDFREYHPKFPEIIEKYPQSAPLIVADFASAIAEKIVREAVQKRFNIIIESTMGNLDVVQKTINRFKQERYNVGLKVLAVHPTLSLLGTCLRYENMIKTKGWGRAVPKDQHDIRYNKLVQNVTALCSDKHFDNIEVYKRNMYFSENNKWGYLPELISDEAGVASSYLKAQHQRDLSFKEMLYLVDKATEILGMMNERGADKNEINGFKKNFGLDKKMGNVSN